MTMNALVERELLGHCKVSLMQLRLQLQMYSAQANCECDVNAFIRKAADEYIAESPSPPPLAAAAAPGPAVQQPSSILDESGEDQPPPVHDIDFSVPLPVDQAVATVKEEPVDIAEDPDDDSCALLATSSASGAPPSTPADDVSERTSSFGRPIRRRRRSPASPATSSAQPDVSTSTSGFDINSLLLEEPVSDISWAVQPPPEQQPLLALDGPFMPEVSPDQPPLLQSMDAGEPITVASTSAGQWPAARAISKSGRQTQLEQSPEYQIWQRAQFRDDHWHCPCCDRTARGSNGKYRILYHIRRDHLNRARMFRCPMCSGYESQYKASVHDHMKRKHGLTKKQLWQYRIPSTEIERPKNARPKNKVKLNVTT